MKKHLPGWAVLLIITLVAGLALGGTYALTKEPIAEQAVQQAQAARKAALPQAERFEPLAISEDAAVDWAYEGLSTVKGKQVPLTLSDIDAIAGATITSTAVVDAVNAAYAQYQAAPSDAAFTAEARGFAGPVAVEATFDGDTIRTLKIGDERFAETEGLGGRAREESFISQFTGGEKAVGYVSQITVKGYKGPVEVTVGLDNTLTLTGISVGGSDFAETAGLGAKAKEPAFQSQFVGKKPMLSVIKSGGTPGENTVDAITAATITSNAVRDAVNGVYKFVKSDVMGIADIEMPARPDDDSLVFSAKNRGFASDVYVEAAFDGEGKITYLSVGDADFAETAGYGAAALEAENQYPFIGAQMPLEIGDVDTLTGATFTKTAIVKGLNQAYEASQGVERPAEPVAEPAALPEKPAEGVFSATAQGFAGPVAVEAAFDDEGKISYISVGDDQFAETPGFGARALEQEELSKFIGLQMPLENVDALTGATFTRTAVINALNQAYDASRGKAEPAEEPAAPVVEEPAAPAKPEETFVGEAAGFMGPVQVEAAFDGDTVTYLAVSEEGFSETPGLGARALEADFQKQFIGKKVPLALADIDALTGATITSTAVVNAVNAAYDASQPKVEEPAAPVEEPAAPAKPDVTFVGEAAGFAGPVQVEAAFDGDIITYLAISEEGFNETPGLGARALEADFQKQFIGKKVPLALADIDALTGATITSTAVVNAVNAAYEASQPKAEEPAAPVEEPAAPAVEEPAAPAVEEPAPVQEPEQPAEPVSLNESVPAGEVLIFFSQLRAEVEQSQGVIQDVRLYQKTVNGGEYAPIAQEEAFRAALKGRSLPLDKNGLAVSAPAYLKEAVVLAVNRAVQDAAEKTRTGSGECIIFFDRVVVEGQFRGDRAVALTAVRCDLNGDSPAVIDIDWASLDQSLPLAVDTPIAGVEEYIGRAILIALNQAYEASLSGQQ